MIVLVNPTIKTRKCFTVSFIHDYNCLWKIEATVTCLMLSSHDNGHLLDIKVSALSFVDDSILYSVIYYLAYVENPQQQAFIGYFSSYC